MKTTDYKISGFNHCEFYVGNAKQTAHYYQTTMGFQLIAYQGLETGVRDRVSYCLLYTSPSPRDMRRSRMPSSA